MINSEMYIPIMDVNKARHYSSRVEDRYKINGWIDHVNDIINYGSLLGRNAAVVSVDTRYASLIVDLLKQAGYTAYNDYGYVNIGW